MTNRATPYQVTIWRGATYRTLGAFPDFASALSCYAEHASDRTLQLVNTDRADSGRDGLTDEERDAVAEVAYAEELKSRKVAP